MANVQIIFIITTGFKKTSKPNNKIINFILNTYLKKKTYLVHTYIYVFMLFCLAKPQIFIQLY